jgi:hypothetical protein
VNRLSSWRPWSRPASGYGRLSPEPHWLNSGSEERTTSAAYRRYTSKRAWQTLGGGVFSNRDERLPGYISVKREGRTAPPPNR